MVVLRTWDKTLFNGAAFCKIIGPFSSQKAMEEVLESLGFTGGGGSYEHPKFPDKMYVCDDLIPEKTMHKIYG